jgi:hypothetical protein
VPRAFLSLLTQSLPDNHKPSQTTSDRTTTLTLTSSDRYNLTIQDQNGDALGDVFTFTGQRTTPEKSYILFFDPTSQKATLEPLDSTYTFNISTKNRADVSSSYAKIYPRKQKTETGHSQGTTDDIFDEGSVADIENDEPDPNNPYDFRHFLKGDEQKRGDESEYHLQSSPDYRTGTGSARNTPLMPAKRAAPDAAKSKSTQSAPKPRKRKSPEPDPLLSRKTAAGRKSQATPTVRLDRRASTHPKPEAKAKKQTTKATVAHSSKIKSAETVHSSDESIVDAGETAASSPRSLQRSPEHLHTHHPSEHEDDEDHDTTMVGGLEIEIPDAHPGKPRHSALGSLGMSGNIGLGGLVSLRSPSAGPISLASAANSSVEGSPSPVFAARQARDDDVIDFGTIRTNDSEDEEGEDADAEGEEDEVDDRDMEPMDLGPPAQQQQDSSGAPASRKMSMAVPVMDDDEDGLYKQMMEGLAGDSSEESEEE